METHYATQAIEELTNKLVRPLKHKRWATIDNCEATLQLLGQSIKFRLPDAGDLLGIDRMKRQFNKEDFDVLHMPYPVTALEYTFTPEKHNAIAEDRHVSARRITLVCDIPAGEHKGGMYQPYIDKTPEFKVDGGLIICGFWSIDVDNLHAEETRWELSAAIAMIPRHQVTDDRPVKKWGNTNPRNQGDLVVNFDVIQPELVQMHAQKSGYDNTMHSIAKDLGDDVNIALDFMLAMSCSNVKVASCEGESREKLNKKRAKTGRVPFFEYKELQIDGVRLDNDVMSAGREGGTTATGRNAPRMHLRRGHMRNLGPGRRTWVNMTVVGAAKDGAIEKDYVVVMPAAARGRGR